MQLLLTTGLLCRVSRNRSPSPMLGFVPQPLDYEQVGLVLLSYRPNTPQAYCLAVVPPPTRYLHVASLVRYATARCRTVAVMSDLSRVGQRGWSHPHSGSKTREKPFFGSRRLCCVQMASTPCLSHVSRTT